MKPIDEMIWPVPNYTDKIHTGIKATFLTRPWLSFTIPQLRQYLERGWPWLANPTEKQAAMLDKIVKCGIQKLIQLGTVKKVTSKVSVEPQWQATSTLSGSGMVNITSDDEVAHNEQARKMASRRALGRKALRKLNA